MSKADEIRVEQTPYFYDRYIGSAAALVHAGIVRREQLPGQPGCAAKTRASYTPSGELERRCGVGVAPGSQRARRIGEDRWEIMVAVGEEEQQRRHGVLRAQDSMVTAELQRRAQAVIATPAQFRASNETLAHATLQVLRNGLVTRSCSGFAIDGVSLQQFDTAVGYLLDTIRSMGLTYDPGKHSELLRQTGEETGAQPPGTGPARGTLRLVSAL